MRESIGVDRRRLRFVMALATVAFAGFMALQSVELRTRRLQMIESATTRADNLSSIAAEYLQELIGAHDAALRQIALESARIGGLTAPDALWMPVLTSARAALDSAGSLSLMSDDRRIVYSTIGTLVGQSREDESLARQLSVADVGTLVVGPPFRIRERPPEFVLPLGQRLPARDRPSAGSVVSTLRLESVRRFLAKLDVGREGSVWVFHSDGVVVFHEPAGRQAIGEQATSNPLFSRAEGSQVVELALTGEGRIFISAIRRLTVPRLAAVVSLSRDELLVDWWRDVTRSIAIFSTIGVLLAVGFAALSRQVAAREEAEARQRLVEEQYRQAQKMEAIGQLSGGIAHDFNNLIMAIRGYCDLVGEALGPGSPQQDDLSEIRRAADRAASLTQQLLAFSRRQILQPRVLDLRDSLRSMESMLRRLIGEHIELVIRTPEQLGHVNADPGQIEQVILNLALNARDAMPGGGTLILELSDVTLSEEYVGAHPATRPGPYVCLMVSDTGTGMDAETRARIFDPFFTTKGQGKGTGLGLATVYGVVNQSGGTIWVYSEPGQGATFKVYLPRVDEPLDRAATPSPRRHRGSETILVVEDDAAVAALVQKVLTRSGYRVLVALTPQAAAEICEDEPGPIGLLLTDVVMPHEPGPALAERLRSGRPDMRVLFMSGYTTGGIVHRGVLNEGTPFVQKPFTPEDLTTKVREILDERVTRS